MKKTAFIFPGQGSQCVGMGRLALEALPEAAAVFTEANEALGFDIKKICFDGPLDELNKTEITQPALLTSSIAALKVLKAGIPGLTPAFVAGHSLGEYTAIVAANGLDFKSAVKLVNLRGKFMQEAVPPGTGKMAAVLGLDTDKIDAACKEASKPGEEVVAANLNSPGQIVISGHGEAVTRASELLKTAGAKKIIPLAVSVPSHSPLMAKAAERLISEMKGLGFKSLNPPLVTNVEAVPTIDSAKIRELLALQLTSPVRWIEIIERLRKEGVEAVIEIGSGKVLTGLVKRIDKDMTALNFEGPGDIETIKTALA
ncbi:MAG: ACP S-malonyltransferase [Deltaproteobacteria bacterium]|nr:ACP S-malonyltransferase [Deltaproteobacteria bacterium]